MTHINRNFLIAWLVHLLTASGLLWGFLATLAIIANDWKQALLWMSASVAADAIDGPISRIFRIQTVLPHFDGALLDTIVDFYTYVIVPVLFMYMAGLFPQDASVWVSILVLLVSGYQFCQKDAKTPDQYFKGFLSNPHYSSSPSNSHNCIALGIISIRSNFELPECHTMGTVGIFLLCHNLHFDEHTTNTTRP